MIDVEKWWKPEDSPQVSCSSASCTGGYLLKRHGFQKSSSKQLHINNPGIPNSFKFQYRSEHPWTLVFWTTPFRRVQTFQTTWNYIGSSGHTLFCQRFFSQLLLHQHVCAIITGGIRPYNKKKWEMFPMVEDMKKTGPKDLILSLAFAGVHSGNHMQTQQVYDKHLTQRKLRNNFFSGS